MTVTLELRLDELDVLRGRADAEGVDVETVLHRLIALIGPPSTETQVKRELAEGQKGTTALMQVGRQKSETDDAEDLAERDREREESKVNLNRWLAEQGRPPVY